MAPKKKPASKRTSLSPRSGSSDGSAAVTRIQDEGAVRRLSNDEHTETLAAEKKALNAKEEVLNAKEEKLNAKEEELAAEKKALNAKEEKLKDALVARVTEIGGDTGTAQFGIYNGSDTTANALKDALKELKDEKKSLTDEKKSLRDEKKSLNAQLEEVEKRLTLQTAAQALPQVDVRTWKWKEVAIPFKTRYEVSTKNAVEAVELYVKGALRLREFLEATANERQSLVTDPAIEAAINTDPTRMQTKLFCNAATIGRGKTRFHHELRTQTVVKLELGEGVSHKFLRFTYNEGNGFTNDGTALRFVQHLLTYLGLPEQQANRVTSADEGFGLIVTQLYSMKVLDERATTKVLIVGVDEIHQGNLHDANAGASLIKDLLAHQDTTLKAEHGVRVVFLFTSLTSLMMAKMTAPSGRMITEGPIPELLPEKVLEMLLEDREIRKRYDTEPFVRQLVELSCDIPRAAFEGIPAALAKLNKNDQAQKVTALRAVLNRAQIADKADIEENQVMEWLANGRITSNAEYLTRVGFARPTASGTTCHLIPLVLRKWAEEAAATGSVVAGFVRSAYDADAVVQRGSEVIAEGVLYNAEAAKLYSLAQLDKTFTFKDYYCNQSYNLPRGDVKSIVSGIEYLEKNDSQVEMFLRMGKILVYPQGEKALEYAVPFCIDNKMMVAGVQVKFVREKTESFEALSSRVKEHKDIKKSHRFPVIATTAPGDPKRDFTGVAFTAESLRDFLRPFGPLRLLFETARPKSVRPVGWQQTRSMHTVLHTRQVYDVHSSRLPMPKCAFSAVGERAGRAMLRWFIRK